MSNIDWPSVYAKCRDRERRRIRRALWPLAKTLLGLHPVTCECEGCTLYLAIEAATRARRGT